MNNTDKKNIKDKNEISDNPSKNVVAAIDKNEGFKYESRSWPMRLIHIPLMFILNLLPPKIARAIFLSFSGPNGDTRTVFKWVATHKALEVMYTYPERRKRGETTISDDFWENFLSNARAVRNRLILVKKVLSGIMKEMSLKKSNIKLLSLGSGSARAVFEIIGSNAHPVQIKLIDMSQRAIKDSEEFIHSLSLDEEKVKVEFHRDYIQNLERYCVDFEPDIIEMVGLLDYLPENQAVDLIKKIHKVLPSGGHLITCNVVPNLEALFVTKGINWPLIYRQPEELAHLLIKGGFPSENLILKYEPFKIHCLAIAKK
jgi:ubiquinone/menaquinone biosynthesis C-methylase UbiE